QRLFTDCFDRQTSMEEHAGLLITEGNTIRKAYVCHARSGRIRPGDVLLFYVSHRKAITTLGTVERVHKDVASAEEILAFAGSRTVYSRPELDDLAESACLIILFLHHFHLPTPPTLRKLVTKDILAGAPQSIMKLDHKRFNDILKEGHANERLAIN
ncbi:MAG: hypothetical protein KAQ74_04445, partial [Dehalococcoidia bacterium]|nr:hypothetical protein [Dehalococcoidia bacterium]